MLTNHTITTTFDGLELTIGRRTVTLTVTVIATPNNGTTIRFAIGRKNYNVRIPDTSLSRHLFFSVGRASRDVGLARRHI